MNKHKSADYIKSKHVDTNVISLEPKTPSCLESRGSTKRKNGPREANLPTSICPPKILLSLAKQGLVF